MTRLAFAIAAAAMVMAAFSLAGSAGAAVFGSGQTDVLLRLSSAGDEQAVRLLLAGGEDLTVLVPELGIYSLRTAAPQAPTLARLRSSGIVAYAEPNSAVRIALVPNDPDYASRQWALAKIDAPAAWDIITGSHPITIAIVDTGIDLGHPDLIGKVVTGVTFVRGTTDAQDDHGHGTHVAGIAAAATDNGIGMAGVSWGGLLMPVKVLDRDGFGTYAELINGIYYAATHGAQILSMSLTSEAYSQALQDAIDFAHDQGALLIAAAGNCALGGAGCSAVNPIMYPAANNHVLSVAASDDQDRRASFSTHNVYVDVAAPGVGIYSTHWQSGIHTYYWMSGTSQATPHVSGLAALVWSGRPWLSNDEVERVLKETARDVNAAQYPGVDNYLGWGRIDAKRAADMTPPVSSVLPLPPAQRAPSFTVAWNGHDDNSGLRSYTVQYREDSGPWLDWRVGVTLSQETFTGVLGHTYYFQSSAVDWAGNVEPFPAGDGDTHVHISTCALSGQVRDNRAVPVAGAHVWIESEGGSATTDESGRYVLVPAVCAGSYVVGAARDGFSLLPPMQNIVVSGSMTTTVPDLFLPPADNVLAGTNWGFESGALTAPWRLSGAVPPEAAAGWGHTGSFAAFLGTPMTATAPGGESAMAVTVTVPVTIYRPTLSFLYRIVSMDNGQHDYFEVRAWGQMVLRDSYPGPDYGTVHDLAWKHAWLDLSQYAGQSVEIRFVVVQGQAYASYPTGAYVDEVSIGSAAGGPFSARLPFIVSETGP